MEKIYRIISSFSIDKLTSGLRFEYAMVGIVACIVLAFFGMRLYKVCLSVIGGVGIGYAAFRLFRVGGILHEYLYDFKTFDFAATIAITTAIIGFVLGIFVPKLVMFVGGIGIGCLGTPMLIQAFLPSAALDDTVIVVIGVTVGIVLGILLSLLFKPIYIILTAIGGMSVAFIILAGLVIPGQDHIIPATIGAVIGIIPAIIQFRSFELYYY